MCTCTHAVLAMTSPPICLLNILSFDTSGNTYAAALCTSLTMLIAAAAVITHDQEGYSQVQTWRICLQ